MNKVFFRYFRVACMATALIALPVAAHAQGSPIPSPANNLIGSYAFQFNGNIFLPAPFNTYNGPFYRNGRFTADGNGNFTVTAVTSNYAGVVVHDLFSGTYKANPDGTFQMTIVDLPLPIFPASLPNIFTFDGVIAAGGNICKVVVSSITLGGQLQPNLGNVISGEFVRQ